MSVVKTRIFKIYKLLHFPDLRDSTGQRFFILVFVLFQMIELAERARQMNKG